jgi:hypothetical protein
MRSFRNILSAVVLCVTPVAAWAQPNINIEVRIESQIQANFDSFTYLPTDVGDTNPQVVTIRNIGPGDLQFPSASPIILDGAFPGQFEVVQPPMETVTNLSPNGRTAFLLRFRPTNQKADKHCF